MEIEAVRERAAAAIHPLKAADTATAAPKDLLLSAQRLEAGRALPPYHLVYFLLVDLLSFRNLGRWEKLAWSVPLDYEGRAYLIEHRKFGVGVFAAPGDQAEADAAKIVRLIRKGIKAAEPYLAWRAAEAVRASALNVRNRAPALFKRFEYFAEAYRSKHEEAVRRKDEVIRTDLPNGGPRSISQPLRSPKKPSGWR